MKALRILACLAAFASVAPLAASAGQIRPYQIKFHNNSDKWAWITVYVHSEFNVYGSATAYCVAPHEYSNRVREGADVPYDIRVEVEHNNCSHPVLLDVKMGWDGKTPYYLTQAPDGKYRVTHTP
jgi:hypothetical protein